MNKLKLIMWIFVSVVLMLIVPLVCMIIDPSAPGLIAIVSGEIGTVIMYTINLRDGGNK